MPAVLEEVINRAACDCPSTPELTPQPPLVSLESTLYPSLPHLEPFSRMQARESDVLLRPPAQSTRLNTEKTVLETLRILAVVLRPKRLVTPGRASFVCVLFH